MGQVLHGCATTTEAIRPTIKHSQERLRRLARRYGINPKTVAKWKKRPSVADLPTGPKEAKSRVLSVEDEAMHLARGLRALSGVEAVLSLSRDAELLRSAAAPRCELMVRTYRGVASFAMRAATAPFEIGRPAKKIDDARPNIGVCVHPGPPQRSDGEGARAATLALCCARSRSRTASGRRFAISGQTATGGIPEGVRPRRSDQLHGYKPAFVRSERFAAGNPAEPAAAPVFRGRL